MKLKRMPLALRSGQGNVLEEEKLRPGWSMEHQEPVSLAESKVEISKQEKVTM